MKCWSRSTLGVIIGILNLLGYILGSIYVILGLVQINVVESPPQQLREKYAIVNTIFIIVLIVCLMMILISALLITGIVKRRHNLMLPWLIISGIGFVINCGRFCYFIFLAFIEGVPLTTILIEFIVGVVLISFSVLLLWLIYTLYRDIRKENSQMPVRVLNDNPVQYYPPPSYHKT